MDKLISIVDYVAYPSFIYMALYLFVLVMWLFATDFYDNIESTIGEGAAFFTTLFVLSLMNAGIGWAFTWVNPINYLLNGFLCFVILAVVVISLCVLLEEFNKYCKRKRGKD